MNAVIGYTQLLQRVPDLSRDQLHALEAIRRSGDHLLALISDILELSRIEAGYVDLTPVTFSVERLLDDLDMMFRVKTDSKGVDLTFERESSVPPFVHADLNRCRQVLINLIGNAVKFTTQGSIHIQVGAGAYDDAGEEILPKGERLLCFEVRDTGPGIREHELDKVFGSFQQTEGSDGSQEGAGLGLTISRNFARLMGGDITVASEFGKGSVFCFHMVVSMGQEADIPAVEAPRRVLGIENRVTPWRVLVVDDRDTNRDLLSRMLSPLGFETQEACDGRECIEIFQSWVPQIVLLDLQMPVMDGWEALTELRRIETSNQKACIIALTASTLSEDKERVLAAGADAFVLKPFRESALLEEIRLHSGVAFRYAADENVDGGQQESLDLSKARELLHALPAALSERLQVAVNRGAINETNALIPELRDHDERLADLVRDHAEGYVLDELRALWKEDDFS